MNMKATFSSVWAVKGVLLRQCRLTDAFRSGKFIVQLPVYVVNARVCLGD
jgi:hypothetical protein